jgi:hypothetical protein
MIRLDIKSNIKQFTRHLDQIQKKQVPFATARALTWTAKETQGALQGQMPIIFNVTRKWWLQRQPTGIKVKPAKKLDPVAIVYSNAYFARLQEEGGIKQPFKGAGFLVPTEQVPKYGRRSGGAAKVLAGKKILRKAGQAGGDPIMTMPNGCKGIFRRRGKKRLPIERLYSFVPEAKITERMNFKALAAQTAKRQFAPLFKKSLAMALATAR